MPVSLFFCFPFLFILIKMIIMIIIYIFVSCFSVVLFIDRDFLKVDPLNRMYSKVQAILVDPSCSGSGTISLLHIQYLYINIYFIFICF